MSDAAGGRSLSAARRWLLLARHVPPAVVSVCVALVLCSGLVTALVLPAASDSTSVLRHPRSVTVTPAGGTPATGHDGQVLHPGDIVTATAGGSGEISTGPRKLWLGGAGSGTQVRVDGPASTEIRRGSVVATNSGRDWSLQADQVAISGLDGAVRIDYDYNTRVADYAGRAVLDVPTGLSMSLTGLDQVEASGSILPAGPVPLKLYDDALDTTAAPALVALDRGLIALASQIDADPIVLAEFHSATDNPSERVLPTAIGAAGAGGTVQSRQRAAVAARGNHGSWGVIAASESAPLTEVRNSLSALLDTAPGQVAALAAAVAESTPVIGTARAGTSGAKVNGQTTSTTSVAPSGTPSPAEGLPVVTPSSGTAPVVVPSAPQVGTLPVSPTTRPPVAPPSGAPAPSPSPVLNVLLDTVGGLLGSPSPAPVHLGPSGGALGGALGGAAASPTPAAAAAAVTPAASPSPTPLVNGLLDSVGLSGTH